MPRDYFQDVTPVPVQNSQGNAPQQRSVRNIEPRTRIVRPPVQQHVPERPRAARGWRTFILWLVAFISILACGVVFWYVLTQGTTVTVVPRTHTAVFDSTATFTAYPDTASTTAGLTYTVRTETLTESTAVTGTGSEQAEEFATGSITIYNNHDSKPFRLIKNTRFETPSGLTFRVRNSVTVPGKTTAGPGSITAVVYADQPGAEFNIGPVEKFTLPGLKSSAPDAYQNVWAQSVQPMAGGFIGSRPKVSDADLAKAKDALRVALEDKVGELLAALGSESGVALPGLYAVSYEVAPLSSEGSSVKITMNAIVRIPILGRAALAKTLADATSAQANSDGVVIVNERELTVQPKIEDPAAIGNDPVTFTISGNARFRWDVDAVMIAEALAGKEKDAFKGIMNNFTNIVKADATVRPFWNTTFPADPGNITITVENEETAP